MGGRSVAFLIHEGVTALDVVGPLDAFAAANWYLPSDEHYEFSIIGPARTAIRASSGLTLTPDLSFGEATQQFATVLVAGGPRLPDEPPDPVASAWLREVSTRAKRIGSICTGAFTLGHAGLLDGRAVTTHWRFASQLAELFPAAHVEHDRIYLRDGPLVTSAGITAGIDLALALVAEDHGGSVALSCAKQLVVVAQRQGGQSQFSPFLMLPSQPDAPLAKVQTYVMEHLAEAFTVNRLAEISGTSSRTMARIFASELGITPHEFIENARIDHARNMLEATRLPLKSIAFDCGFGSAEQMRLVFQRRLGVAPALYRDMFTTQAWAGRER